MKCMNDNCEIELVGRQKTYCSDRCRKAQTRTDEAEQAKSDMAFELVPNQKVYDRPAVRFDLKEDWDLRPEPLDPNDSPEPGNRGAYTRPDGTGYFFDICANAHPIDYEARREAFLTLEGWACGKGTSQQVEIGLLAKHYRAEGFDLDRYLAKT
jgi:hypothetical protein